MERANKEGKRGIIQSFFNLPSGEKQKSDELPISGEMTVPQSDQVNLSFTACEEQQQKQQQEKSPPSSSSSNFLLLLSPSSNSQYEAGDFPSSSNSRPLLTSASTKRQERSVSSSINEQQQQQESISLSSSPEFSPIASPISSKKQQLQGKVSSTPLESPSLISSSSDATSTNNLSSNNPLSINSSSNNNGLSRSMNEPPSQPLLTIYPLNKDKRCFRSQWFSQFRWLEYSIEKDSAYCYLCRHFSNGTNMNSRVRSACLVRRYVY